MANFIQRFQKIFFVQKKLFFFVVVFSIFIFSIFIQAPVLRSYKKVNVTYYNKTFIALVADTPQKQSKGLAVLPSINNDEAMLFVFQRSGIHPFWMKDMKFSIDIVWLNENKEVVFIREHALPEEYPIIYTPDRESRYVLEFVDGFVKKNDVQISDRFGWNNL